MRKLYHLYYNKSMSNRHEYREKIIFVLYQHLLLDKDLETCFNDNFEESEFDDFLLEIRNDLIANKNDYIAEISNYLNKWKFERLNLIEQAILLLATSESKLKLNDKAIIINEAINIAKEYCDEDAYKYINGVLDNICKN